MYKLPSTLRVPHRTYERTGTLAPLLARAAQWAQFCLQRTHCPRTYLQSLHKGHVSGLGEAALRVQHCQHAQPPVDTEHTRC
eukprot:scaffold298595_cov18-Tisochrysis_lutea.AAC.1